MTDGTRVYFADFGLATCEEFDLSEAEWAFLRDHATYDRAHTTTQLVHGLLTDLLGLARQDCHAYLLDYADRGYPQLPPAAAAIVARHAPVALVRGEFYRALQADRAARYPTERLEPLVGG